MKSLTEAEEGFLSTNSCVDIQGDQSPGVVPRVGGRYVLHGEESETQAARQSWTGQPQTRPRSRNSEETGTVK